MTKADGFYLGEVHLDLDEIFTKLGTEDLANL
jgi:hypothetical protein